MYNILINAYDYFAHPKEVGSNYLFIQLTVKIYKYIKYTTHYIYYIYTKYTLYTKYISV